MVEGLLGFVLGLLVGAAATWLLLRRSPTSVAPVPHHRQPSSTANTPPLSIPAGASLLDAMLGDTESAESSSAESSPEQMAADLRQNLRVKYLHDEVKIKRALDVERQRDPEASEIELLKAAIYRWERENG